jgi:hypothetical protein
VFTRRSSRLGLLWGSLVLAAAIAPATAAADRYVSTSGSGGSCTAAAPCGSFNAAYAVAAPGEVVHVAGGSYGGQSLNAGAKASGPRVVFQPAPGASVTVNSINAYANHIEFRDMRVLDSTYNREGADDIAYVRVSMKTFLVRSASNISYINSDVGPNSNADEMNWISAAYQSQTPARNVLFDGTTIHDFVKHNSGAHIDCIGIDDVDGLTIRNSVIRNCEHFSLLFGTDASTNRGARNVLVENNFLDCCVSGYYSIGLGQVDGPMMVRHNSTNKAFGWLGGPVNDLTIDSNILPNNSSANCDGATWRYNIVNSGSACGGNGRVASPGFRNAAAADFHLLPGSAAIDAANPDSGPANDIDGESRAGNRPDVGADEANPVAPAPPSGGNPSGGQSGGKTFKRVLNAGGLRATARMHRVSLGRMINRGLRVSVRCSQACIIGAKAKLSKRSARRAGLGRGLDADVARRGKAGVVVLRLRPSKREGAKLRRLGRVTLTVHLRARSGGRQDRAAIRVTLRR